LVALWGAKSTPVCFDKKAAGVLSCVMPQATARRIAELLIADHPSNEFLEVDFMDASFSELMAGTLASLGCIVERTGSGTRLRVKVLPAHSEGFLARAMDRRLARIRSNPDAGDLFKWSEG
jgi:hypothetical protein